MLKFRLIPQIVGSHRKKCYPDFRLCFIYFIIVQFLHRIKSLGAETYLLLATKCSRRLIVSDESIPHIEELVIDNQVRPVSLGNNAHYACSRSNTQTQTCHVSIVVDI